jgi:hypothetical protein
MQRHACLWITGTFKTSPVGAAETLMGMSPIHLHVKKQSHVHTRTLQATHTFCRLVNRNHMFSIETLKGQICRDLKSPIIEAWLNLDFSSLDLDPVNRFDQPGLHPKDLYHGHIVYNIVSSPPKTDKDHKKFMAVQINLLHSSVDAASHSPQHMCIVTDASTPPLPLQSVVAFHLWRGTSTMTGLQPALLCLMMLTYMSALQVRKYRVFHSVTDSPQYLKVEGIYLYDNPEEQCRVVTKGRCRRV